VGCLVALYIGGQEFVRSLPERALAASKKVERPAAAPETDGEGGAAKPKKRVRVRRRGWVTGGWR
jgi:hypothetical protein